MRYTNSLGIPDILADALMRDDYTKGDAKYSVTELLAPPRMVALQRHHADQVTQDVAECLASVFGRATHHIIQSAKGTGVPEERLFMDLAGVRLSGAIDYAKDGTIHDWKTCKWLAIADGPKPEWEQQLNGYAMLARANGRPVTQLVDWALCKDWSRDLPNTEPRCPKLPVVKFVARLWSDEEARGFFSNRLWLHERAQQAMAQGDEPAPCTIEERWGRGEHWAAMKPDAKRSSKNFYTHAADVLAWINAQKQPSDYAVEHRPAVYVRCRAWCLAAPFCTQYKSDPGGGTPPSNLDFDAELAHLRGPNP